MVLIEPDVSVRDALTVLLESEGWEVSSLSDCTRLAREIEDTRVLAVISEAQAKSERVDRLTWALTP